MGRKIQRKKNGKKSKKKLFEIQRKQKIKV